MNSQAAQTQQIEDAQIVTDQTLAPSAVVVADAVSTSTEAIPGSQTTPPLSTASAISETIVWNQTGNNLSVGMAILNKDQLHISIHRTTDLPKNLKTEMAPNLTLVKPSAGMLFKMGQS